MTLTPEQLRELLDYARGDRWIAEIKKNYRKIHLGMFSTEADAIAARKAAEARLGFHPNHGRKKA